MNIKRKYGEDAKLVWKDRKRFLGMPLSFTRYYLIKKDGNWCKVFLDVGFTYSSVDEVNVYRICDISLRQSLLGKMLNVGTIILYSSDESKPTLALRNIKDPYRVKDIFTDLVEEQRKLYNVRFTEFHNHD